MNKNSVAIISFCSTLCKGNTSPLSNEEWSALALCLIEKGVQPMELLDYSISDFTEKLGVSLEYAKRLSDLAGRTASLYFELSKYENMGIGIVTRADSAYPKDKKRELNNACPPIFYYAGDITILDKAHITLEENDTLSESEDMLTVKYTPALMKSIKQSSVVKSIQKRKLLILSQAL